MSNSLKKLRIAGKETMSIVDGPGFRYTLFLQGCNHQCKGCHNKSTWSSCGGTLISIEDIIKDIKSEKYIDGITISGGEPLNQARELCVLLKLLKAKQYHIIMYTGYTYEQVLQSEEKKGCLDYIDVLIDGKYIEELRSLELKFKGSANQRVINVPMSLMQNKVVTINW